MSTHFKMKLFSLFLIALGCIGSQTSKAQRLPNTDFGIFPLFGTFTGSAGSLTEGEAIQQINELKAQIGENKGHFKVGFGGIFSNETTLDRNCRLLKANNLSHVTIIGVQTHAIPTSIKNIANADLRNYQWRKDGVLYNGVAGGEGRDVDVVSPSRYATALRAEFKRIVQTKAAPIKRVMNKYPGVIVGVNACIEQGLADATVESRMGDYSPFAVTEFRDWLLHRGMYDASNGDYPDEGASADIIGTLLTIDGKLRSQFYDDPTPDDANGTGVSFNTKFGTNFTTWTLKYWDLTSFPDAITNTSFDITPSTTGFTNGGFEAPRTRNASNSFWKAWTYDLKDQGDTYPANNPTAPAYGFRQVMVRNFVNDILFYIQSAGIPSEIITAHQIPGEMLSDANRSRNVATPIWTGLSKYNGTVGITRYGSVSSSNLDKITQYSNNWGIYEWHPKKSPTDNVDLKNRTISEITKFYNANCRIVCPFTWTKGAGGLIGGASLAGLYPVKGCGVSEGLKQWLESQEGYTGGVVQPPVNKAPEVTFTIPTESHITVIEGYKLNIEVNVTDADNNLTYTVLYIDEDSIRKESVKPYEWGHSTSPNPDELNGLPVGIHTIKVVAVDELGARGFAEFTLEVKLSTAVNTSAKIDASFARLYPNPVNNELHIEIPDLQQQKAEINIFDCMGKHLHSSSVTNRNSSIQLNHLATGTYIVIVSMEGKTTTLKVAKN